MAPDYDVGYGKPPKRTRFKKGQSGNPAGRKRGSKNLTTDLSEELAERIVVREGDRTLTISKQRALVKSLAAKALKGDTRAATLVLNMVWRVLERDGPDELAEDLTADDLAILESFEKRRGGGRTGGVP